MSVSSITLRLPGGKISEPAVAEHFEATLMYRDLVMYLMDEDGIAIGHVQAYDPGRSGTLWLFPTHPKHGEHLDRAVEIGAEFDVLAAA